MKIMRQIKRTEDASLLQEDLQRFERYCCLNRLDLNVSKCYVCSFTRKPNPIIYDYTLKNSMVTRVSHVKDLGVTFDSKLIFDVHIESIVKRAAKALGFICRISSDFKNIKTIKILFCSLVRSHLEYASQVWNPMYGVYINRIESIQRRFTRYIQYRSNCYLPNYISRCKKFHLLPLYERRKIADLSFLCNIMNGSIDVTEFVSKIGLRVPSAFLRRSHLLHIPAVSTSYRQNSYLVRASRMYNVTCQDVDIDLFTTSVPKMKRICCQQFFGDISR